jgi:hypothetical protein
MRVAMRRALAGAWIFSLGISGLSWTAHALSSPPVQRIRVLVHNLWGRNEGNCENRYRAIARKIREAHPRYDLVIFTEHWVAPAAVCNAEVLTDALTREGFLKGTTSHPRSEALWETSGGLSVFTPHPIKEVYSARFVESRKMPLSGTLFTRIELSPGREIDLWATHLETTGADGCDEFCRLGQIGDLERIDYLFAMTDKFFGGKKGPSVILKKMEIVKWRTPSGIPVSDHFGLDATLEIDWSSM